MKNWKWTSKMVIFALLLGILNISPAAPAKAASVLTVGPGQMYETPQAAVDAAVSGDTIEIYAGNVYYGANAGLILSGKDNITLRGVNGRPHMMAQPGLRLTWGKALWVINAANTVIENIEFSGASCSDKNGAGIRVDGGTTGTVTIKNCYFHDNDDGILSSAPESGVAINLIVENSEFSYNGYGDGLSHNIYVGGNTNFTMKYCYSHNARNGHLVKSRGITNHIEYNRITDDITTDTSYSTYNIDLPEGGTSYIIGNLLQQGDYAPNNCMVYYAAETPNGLGRNCYVINNTFVNDAAYATFIRCRDDAAYSVLYKNNIFTGAGGLTSGGSTTWVASNNYNYSASSDPGFFTNKANCDYTLTSAATAVINQGTDPGTGDGYSLMPVSQYAHSCGYTGRSVVGSAVDIGAYEYPDVISTTDPTPTPTPEVTPPPAPSNLALGKAVTASDQALWDGIVTRAVDGDSSTGWYVFSNFYPQWIRIDLGGTYSIGKTELEFTNFQASYYGYKVEVSTDGENYTTVVDKSSNTLSALVLTDTFAAVNARYVRITVTGCSNPNQAVRINEIRVLKD